MEKNKKAYEKPMLYKVRLEVKTSILAACNISLETTPLDLGTGDSCKITGCRYQNP